MMAELRPSLDFDVSSLFIQNRALNEDRIPKLVCSIGMLLQDLVRFNVC